VSSTAGTPEVVAAAPQSLKSWSNFQRVVDVDLQAQLDKTLELVGDAARVLNQSTPPGA
jgi:hypothetical protein